MPRPIVTIVGRPNVGKSTLFNRLVGERRALVDDLPGVTRDRQYGDVRGYGRPFTIVDTGGFEPEAEEGDLLALMRAQAQLAVDEADVIILLMDGKEGLTRADEQIAEQLRRSKRPVPVFPTVNKLESHHRREDAYDFYRLGVEELFFVSAEHGQGVAELMDRVVAALPPVTPGEEFDELDTAPDPNETRVAVVGRPNVGKSTLINRLLGEERLLASDLPGTTRDAIDTVLDRGERRYRLIDTAGVRRKRSIKLRLESWSVIKAFKSIDRAHVAVLLIDATEPFVDQEARLGGMIDEKGRAAIIVVNKWDAIEKDTGTAGAYVKRLREQLEFMRWAPVLFISAKTGQRVHRLLDLVDKVRANHRRRIPTAQLNRYLRDALARHQLPMRKTRKVKLYYLTQVGEAPPHFVAIANDPQAVHFSYARYLLNGLREQFDFEGTPIRLDFRARSRKRRDDLPDDPVAAAEVIEAERAAREAGEPEWPEPEWDDAGDAAEALAPEDADAALALDDEDAGEGPEAGWEVVEE
jgi:GTP-binding protein